MADSTVKFEDFSDRVEEALNGAALKWLEESAIAIQSHAVRNAAVGRVNGGKTKGSWKYVVDKAKLEATVGNTEENAIWEEFGTGEYALEGKGRKGGWYVLIGDGEGQISQAVVDAYGMAVRYGKKGKRYAYIKGKKPKRTLKKAYDAKKGKITNRAKAIFKEQMG